MFIHPIYNSLHLLAPTSQSITFPPPSPLAVTSLFSISMSLFLVIDLFVPCFRFKMGAILEWKDYVKWQALKRIILFNMIWPFKGHLYGSAGKEPTCQCRRHKRHRPSLDWEDTREKGMATHCSIHAWRIPWTEEPGSLQSMGLQRVRHNWMTNTDLLGLTGRGF